MCKATLVLSLLVVSSALADDLTITSRITRDGGEPQTVTSYLASDHVRMVQPDAEVILDGKTGAMTVLDERKKTYYVVTKKDLDEMSASMEKQMNSPEMQQAQEQMKNLPPEMQKRMEAMMGGAMKTEVVKTGKSRTIAGYRCDEYSVTMGSMSTSLQCLTTELKFPASSYDTFRSYTDSLKSMMAAFGPMAKGMGQMQQEMKKLKGFALASTSTTTVMGRSSTSTSEVTSIKSGPIPASAWEIPAGYKQVDSPMKSMAKRR